ncbi:MAG: peroxiredoxin family protein [Rhodospirillaceae bacterium]|nr:peroxiredoxin family protein [Rhodospirillaceae bacterium]
MRGVSKWGFLLAAILFSGAVAAESLDIGPKVGARIPEQFVVSDQAAVVRAFSDIVGEKGVVIAFVRSAAWCPYCQAQLKDLQLIAGSLAGKGFPLVSISYDAPDVLAKFAAKHDIKYTMLSDKGSVLIDAFNIRDPQYKEGTFAYGVPKPVIFVIDKSGIVRAKLAEESYKTRPQIASIAAAVDGVLANR